MNLKGDKDLVGFRFFINSDDNRDVFVSSVSEGIMNISHKTRMFFTARVSF